MQRSSKRAGCQESNHPPAPQPRPAASLPRGRGPLRLCPTGGGGSSSLNPHRWASVKLRPCGRVTNNQPGMLCSMNYLSDLHFVREGRWRGPASSKDHDDEDGDEEEGEDCAHHSTSHDDGVRPLRLRLV